MAFCPYCDGFVGGGLGGATYDATFTTRHGEEWEWEMRDEKRCYELGGWERVEEWRAVCGRKSRCAEQSRVDEGVAEGN